MTRLRLLQGFALERQGERIDLPLGMQRLLAFVALRGATHRCVVAGTLWPDVPESQASANLRTCIWRINRRLPQCIVTEGFDIAARGLWVDSLEQERVTRALLREEIDDPQWIAAHLEILSRGELLPGWYDEWVMFERERLSQLRLHALEHAAVAMARGNRFGAALHLALEAVRTDPLRETANAALIEVYLAEGNVSDAVHHYAVFRGLLQRELGLEPSAPIFSSLARRAGARWALPRSPTYTSP